MMAEGDSRGMKLGHADWLALRRSLLRCAALLVVAAALALSARQMAAQAASAEKREMARHDAWQARLAHIAAGDANAADAQRQDARYRELLARGIVGPEHRLDWVERIAQIRQARRLIDVQYEMAPQISAAAELLPGASAGGYEFMTSAMKLQMALLHEDDLLGFLDELAGSVSALLQVRACHVERVSASAEAPGAARLNADCRVDWITLRALP